MFIYIKVSRTDHFHIVVGGAALEKVVHGKHRQIDRDDQESCEDRHEDQQCRLEHRDRLLYSSVRLACEVLADDVQCLVEFTGLFADRAHFLQCAREVRAVFHAVPELLALLDL